MIWLAVDEDGFVGVYNDKPIRNNLTKEWDGDYERIATWHEKMYSTITWKDEPIVI